MRFDTKGFTLIELLTVILIIGALAAIALPKFVNTREKSYYAAMRSDLRNLATAEENYFAKNYVYADNTALLGVTASQRVMIDIPVATDVGWRATATYYTAKHLECEIYYGTAGGATVATHEGVVMCN